MNIDITIFSFYKYLTDEEKEKMLNSNKDEMC